MSLAKSAIEFSVKHYRNDSSGNDNDHVGRSIAFAIPLHGLHLTDAYRVGEVLIYSIVNQLRAIFRVVVMPFDTNGITHERLPNKDTIVKTKGIQAERYKANCVRPHRMRRKVMLSHLTGRKHDQAYQNEKKVLHKSLYSSVASNEGHALAAKSRCPWIVALGNLSLR
jgi:hypothetical protein